MSELTPHCCPNYPKYLVSYRIGSQFFVCGDCISREYWSRGIKEKIPIAELEGHGRPKSSSATELITNG